MEIEGTQHATVLGAQAFTSLIPLLVVAVRAWPTLRDVRRRPGERLHAWVLTGPLGHLWSALADMTLIWARYLAHRARGG